MAGAPHGGRRARGHRAGTLTVVGHGLHLPDDDALAVLERPLRLGEGDLLLVARTRARASGLLCAVRRRHAIAGYTPFGFFEDIFCAFYCGFCTLTQLARALTGWDFDAVSVVFASDDTTADYVNRPMKFFPERDDTDPKWVLNPANTVTAAPGSPAIGRATTPRGDPPGHVLGG